MTIGIIFIVACVLFLLIFGGYYVYLLGIDAGRIEVKRRVTKAFRELDDTSMDEMNRGIPPDYKQLWFNLTNTLRAKGLYRYEYKRKG
jgi:hypothetical protein